MPSDWNAKSKKEEFVDFCRITMAVNPAGGGIVACHATGVIRVLPEEPQILWPVSPAFSIMEHWVYILQSQSTRRYYCGQTTELRVRILQHNDPNNNLAKTTKRFKGPWILVWSRPVSTGFESRNT